MSPVAKKEYDPQLKEYFNSLTFEVLPPRDNRMKSNRILIRHSCGFIQKIKLRTLEEYSQGDYIKCPKCRKSKNKEKLLAQRLSEKEQHISV